VVARLESELCGEGLDEVQREVMQAELQRLRQRMAAEGPAGGS